MNNKLKNSENESHQKVAAIIDDIEIGMITTHNQKGDLVSRPMQAQEADADGCLWFFTSNTGELIGEIHHNSSVNVTFAAPNKNKYLSIAGEAFEVRDRQKMQELWKPALKAWFKDGIDSPDITLLKVEMQTGQFWDAPYSTAVEVAGFLKSLVTDAPFRPGRNEKVDLRT